MNLLRIQVLRSLCIFLRNTLLEEQTYFTPRKLIQDEAIGTCIINLEASPLFRKSIMHQFDSFQLIKYSSLSYPVWFADDIHCVIIQPHMIRSVIKRALAVSFKGRLVPRMGMKHIKNMIDENTRVEAQKLNDLPLIQENSRVYKPSHTIEFNRDGEVLLYSASTLKNETIYFKYPYVFYESFIPLAFFNYLYNPLGLNWYLNDVFLYSALFTICARCWDVSDQKYLVQKLFLLRGGRVLKAETMSMSGDRFTYWFETFQCKPLTPDERHFADRDEADFLHEEGQLKHNLAVQLDDMKEWGTNSNDSLLRFKTYGTVHQPELFEAALKGYNIDTTDFVINTADNVRFHEGNHDA